jgi:hypothetical protein
MSGESEFGKDLGLMHEVVVTGRKVGFERNDWAKLAHSNELARATLNFVRSAGASQFLSTITEDEKIVRLAKLTEAIAPYDDWYKCPHNMKGRLLKLYTDLGIVLSEKDNQTLSEDDSRHSPFRIWVPIAKEVLGVEFHNDNDIRICPDPKGSRIEFFVTAVTSIPNILAFIEAVKKEGLVLAVTLKIKEN